MTKPDDQAYPRVPISSEQQRNYTKGCKGMTKREAIATKLFAGILANTRHLEVGDMSNQAEAAVQHADALITALNKD